MNTRSVDEHVPEEQRERLNGWNITQHTCQANGNSHPSLTKGSLGLAPSDGETNPDRLAQTIEARW